MNYESDISLIDSHSKSNGGTNHLYLVIQKVFLSPVTLQQRQTGMICYRIHMMGV